MEQTKHTPHQSKLVPSENKFHKGNGQDKKHYWLTPPDLYKKLNEEFHFDFDPCPYPLPDGFDGLTCEWGSSNYVNPPFGSILHQGKKKGPTAWVRKAIEEYKKGKTVVLVYPIDKWVLMILSVIGSEIRNLGDVRWHAIEDNSQGKGTGRHIACFVLKAGLNETAAERDQLKEENERLKDDRDSYAQLNTLYFDENTAIKDLNRELLEALKYASRFLGKGVADMNYINQVIQKAS